MKNTYHTFKKSFVVFLKWLVFSLGIGVLVGIIGVLFHFAIEYATELRMQHGWLLYLLPVGGLLIVLLYKLFGIENDRGTNLVLAAVRSNEKLTAKMAPLIFISTVLTHLLGGSSGREGAALQLGGSISGKIGRMMRLDEKDERIIMMCGMSAAFAALFGTPITAVVFSMEVISVGVMYYSALVPCALASVLGAYIAGLFHVLPTSFVISGVPVLSPSSGGRVVALGVLCALVSIIFCIILSKWAGFYGEKVQNKELRAVLGGVLLIGLTLIVGCRDYNGAGMDVIGRALSGEARPEAFFLKMVFTAITLGAGFKGGEIVPTFFTGATFGAVAGGLLGLSPSFGAAVGLAAVFCGVTNCPMTSIILSIELFGTEGLVFYGLACAVSYMLSGYLGLYGEQKIVYSKLKPEFINTNTMKVK